VLLVFGALALIGAAAKAQTYNVEDFSAVNNPNGVWSYGAIPSLGGPFTLLTQKLPNYYDLDHWLLYNQAPFYPAVVHNASALPNTSWAINPFPAGAVGIHPSSTGDKGVIRFTSPAAAWYDVQGAFDALGGATVDVYVYHGVNELVQGLLTGGSISFATTIYVGLGETVDFIVGSGPNNNHVYDGTRVQGLLRVRQDLGDPMVPEPGVLALLMSGGIAASLFVARRSRA